MSWDDEDLEDVSTNVNKWSGEDEDNVADSWDAEPAKPTTTVPKPKKTKEEKIAEREAKRRQEVEEREKRAAEEAAANSLTELQRQQISRKAELDLLGDTFGTDQGDKTKSTASIDALHPTTKDEFNQLSQLLQQKLVTLDKSPHYPLFLESLIRGVVANVDVESLRKLSAAINTISNEKQKLEKGKPKQKRVVKAAIKVTKGADVMNDMMVEGADVDFHYSEDDDFM